MRQPACHSMRIRDLSLQVKLGCSVEERSSRQEVRISMELRFREAPRGTESDDLRDTICYARICDALREQAESGEFQLIEKMARDFHAITGGIIEGRADISLTVHKVNPPVAGLIGGVEYRVGNFP